ncbi:restriction endonuclease subunit S [Escherichia coli]|uniref:restriction endonuclease subunit S n=1 Tax=Escherichia coli TaxID=562 RepID=UPI0017DAA845|nr:restriction endonuclease subunit S [Escherichia coli]EFB7642321.1 restriction endonuclease subunit S [Escherichia coli]EFD8936531.1 restriction endonuclease subunit S [Escherichia coli]EFO0623816.1 restriction endonuclease subunit S [Escherichia coli]EGB0858377.1 restriction endonuclease subunit S [Escherichia coli]EIG0448230.1 restriction endonuclease subunit S [Escherichia coli]
MATYKNYQQTNLLGLEILPSHWEVKKIKHLFSIGRGRVISQAELEDEGMYPVYSSQTHNDGCLGYINSYDFNCEQITWTTDGANAGTVFLRKGKYNCTNVCGTLQPINKENFLQFHLYCLQYINQFHKRPDTNGAKIMNNEMAEVYIPLPSNQEQLRITTFLDHETAKIDNLIEKQQQFIELLKEKRQAVISHAVTKGLNPDVPMKDSGVEWLGKIPIHWEMKKLAYLGSARNGLTYSPESITDNESGILVLRSSNIQNSCLSFDDNVYVKAIIPEQFLVKENDLLICSRNGSRNLIGKNALINKKAEGMAFGAFMAIFRSNINKYLFWVLNSTLFDYQSGSFLTSTINQLTIGNLNSMEVPVPPSKEQKDIESHLSKKNYDFIELISNVHSSISLLQERRTALISAAVTGKIDLRNWTAPIPKAETPTEASA